VAELIPVQRISSASWLLFPSWLFVGLPVLLDHSCYCNSSVEPTLCTRCCLSWPSST